MRPRWCHPPGKLGERRGTGDRLTTPPRPRRPQEPPSQQPHLGSGRPRPGSSHAAFCPGVSWDLACFVPLAWPWAGRAGHLSWGPARGEGPGLGPGSGGRSLPAGFEKPSQCSFPELCSAFQVSFSRSKWSSKKWRLHTPVIFITALKASRALEHSSNLQE